MEKKEPLELSAAKVRMSGNALHVAVSFLSLVPFGLAWEGSTEGRFASNTGCKSNPQPAVCPDEGLTELNTED
jgi:hypothetical protein